MICDYWIPPSLVPVSNFGAGLTIAQLAITHMVTQRAREHEVLQDMLQCRLGRSCLGLQEDADDFLFECCMESTLPNKRYPKAPALFSLPKWKSTEYDPENPVVKWRDIVYSFGYQTGRRTGLVLWGKLSLSGKGLGQGFLNVAEMMVLVVFLDSIVF